MTENNKTKIQSYTDLLVWKQGHKFVIFVYQITKHFPREELFSLTDQIKRAAVSITRNIAEGFSRQSYKEKLQFYFIALGSITEIQNQLLIAKDVYYIDNPIFQDASAQIVSIQKLLSLLIKSTKQRI